jgi:hypothetical protein
MSIRWPWVSRRYAEFLSASYERMRDERDTIARKADRAIDQLIAATGRVPISDEGIAGDAAVDKSLDIMQATMFGEDEGDASFSHQPRTDA